MRKRALSLVLATALLGAVFAVPSASARQAIDGEDARQYIVPTRHGKLFLEVVHPTSEGKLVRGPVVLTLSPYSVLGRNGDKDDFVPRGYLRAWADVVGTGNSGGCFDYGGKREKETGYDLVEWIAKQKWSDGKVGMYGGSYNGTTANATAVMQPPHLKTIVPVAAISRWYGYAYSGGVRYSHNNEYIAHQGASALDDQGFDTPLAFDFGLAVPPPIDAGGKDWAERVQSAIQPCDELEHTQHGYDDTPDYDKFWIERDYLRDAGKVKIPVLVASNWGDWNVKQEESWNWFNALKRSRKAVLYMGSRWDDHGAPVHGSAEENRFIATVKKWFDHYLMGKDNGIDKLPSVLSQTADQDGRGKWSAGKPKTRNVVLYAQSFPVTEPGVYQWQILPSKYRQRSSFGPARENRAAFPSTNINTETHALHHGRVNHDWIWFEAPPFKKDTRIFGEIKVQVYSTVGREWVTITPTIADVEPSDHVIVAGSHVANTDKNSLVGVTRGFLDSRYRNGLAKQKLVKPGKPFMASMKMKPVDYTFKKGHFLGLNIQTEILEWHVPKPYPGCEELPDASDPTGANRNKSCATFWVNWEENKTRVIIPVVDAPKNVHALFGGSHH